MKIWTVFTTIEWKVDLNENSAPQQTLPDGLYEPVTYEIEKGSFYYCTLSFLSGPMTGNLSFSMIRGNHYKPCGIQVLDNLGSEF